MNLQLLLNGKRYGSEKFKGECGKMTTNLGRNYKNKFAKAWFHSNQFRCMCFSNEIYIDSILC